MTDSQNSLAIAYKLLKVNPNCSVDELRSNFKQLCIKYHPDKGGDENIFNLIVDGFKTILHHKKTSEEQKQHHQLKKEKESQTETLSSQTTTIPLFETSNSIAINEHDTGNVGEFNRKFNKFFDKHRTVDINIERGYQSFIDEKDVKTSSKNYKIQKYSEPCGSIQCKSLGFHELGENTKDFSGDNQDMKKLQYMDYQYAHTTSKLIDPNRVKVREEYDSIDQLRAKREKENFDMTDTEKNLREKLVLREKKREQKRLNNLLQYDDYLNDHQMKLNQLRIK